MTVKYNAMIMRMAAKIFLAVFMRSTPCCLRGSVNSVDGKLRESRDTDCFNSAGHEAELSADMPDDGSPCSNLFKRSDTSFSPQRDTRALILSALAGIVTTAKEQTGAARARIGNDDQAVIQQ